MLQSLLFYLWSSAASSLRKYSGSDLRYWGLQNRGASMRLCFAAGQRFQPWLL